MGSRYRLQAGVSAGGANDATLLADYRRYLPLTGPFSLAGRAMHYGRYGADAEDPRVQELFIGYPHLVRGYDGDWFASGDCGTSSIAGCRSRGHVFGSRLAVASLELRTSLSGYRGLLTYARANDRPGKPWRWQFSLTPGF